MKRIFNAHSILALAVTVGSSSGAFAQTLSADEIHRRLEIQAQDLPETQQNNASQTRGMRFDYGQAPETPADTTDTGQTLNPSTVIYETIDTAIPLQTYEPTEPSTNLPADPIYQQPEAGIVTEPAYIDVTPTAFGALPVATEEYRPVQDDGRIDLRIYFEWNSAALRPDAIGQLSELCTAIRQFDGSRLFKIIGHTDKSGSDAYNLYLSRARAREVKRHLVEECAIPEDALLATGEGERQSDPNSPQRAPDERLVELQLVG